MYIDFIQYFILHIDFTVYIQVDILVKSIYNIQYCIKSINV